MITIVIFEHAMIRKLGTPRVPFMTHSCWLLDMGSCLLCNTSSIAAWCGFEVIEIPLRAAERGGHSQIVALLRARGAGRARFMDASPSSSSVDSIGVVRNELEQKVSSAGL